MIAPVLVEFAKLKGSLVLLVCATPPVMLGVLAIMVGVTGNGPDTMATFMLSGSALWAYFLLPMFVTGAAALMAQLEHASGAWRHILALPVSRWRVFAAKAIVLMTLVVVVTVAVGGTIPLAGWAIGALAPEHALTGAPPWERFARSLTQMAAASVLMLALQLWVALRFASVAAPIVLGIGGTFVAVAATSARSGVYFPWLMPVSALSPDPERQAIALALGGGAGLALLALMVWSLARRDSP